MKWTCTLKLCSLKIQSEHLFTLAVCCALSVAAEQVTFLQGIKVFASGRNRILNDLSLCFKRCPGLSETDVSVFWGMFVVLHIPHAI